MSSLFWIFLVMLLFLFVFAVIALGIIQPSEEDGLDDYNQIVRKCFPNLYTTMITLVQGMFFDGFADIYVPIVLSKPLLLLYFACYILTTCIALMNCMIGLVVQSTSEQAEVEKAERKRREA